jgi:NAD(P)H-dependent FMN reductase
MRLLLVTVSTRPTRKGPAVAAWFEQQARAHGKFDVEPIDLADLNLPLLDEPEHPRLRKYQHEHTKRWSALVDAADAFVFVMPEYNHSPAPALTNALDYLVQEWAYKPAAIVSYGGVSGGLRATQALKPTLNALKIVPIVEQVALMGFTKFIDAATGTFTPEPASNKAAATVLGELHRWSEALRVLRAPRQS